MFKFKSIYSQTGSFSIGHTPHTLVNGSIETEDKNLAEFLRANANFIEIVEEKEESSELEELKAKATELEIPFGVNIGIKTLKERIEAKEKEAE